MITKEKYLKNIPECCELKTIEEHMKIMLCWGIVDALRKGREKSRCGICEFNREKAKA